VAGLLWIDHYSRRGQRVPKSAFLDAFTSSFRSEHFSQDLLDELERTGLVTISQDGYLSITVNAEEWMRDAQVWKTIIAQLEAGAD
jgi:hypothetical protein